MMDADEKRSSEVKRAVEALLGSSGEAVVTGRKPIDHQTNRLYDVRVDSRHLIAKEFVRPEEIEAAPRREYESLLVLRPLEVAPRPVAYRAEPAAEIGPLVVYEYLSGEMWDRRCPKPAELGQLAELWLRINSLPVQNLRGDWSARSGQGPAALTARARAGIANYLKWTATEFPGGRRAAALIGLALESRFDVLNEMSEANTPLCFGRLDGRFANIISRPDGRLGMVDWEDSGLHDPALGIADVLTHANQEDLLTSAEWEPFLESYLSEWERGDPSVRRRLSQYVVLLSLFWLAILLEVGLKRALSDELAGWLVNGRPAEVRLRRYLARSLAWPARSFKREEEALADLVFFQSEDRRAQENRRGGD